MAVRICAVDGVCIIRHECRVIYLDCEPVPVGVLVGVWKATVPVCNSVAATGCAHGSLIRVGRLLPRLRALWELQPRCEVDHPSRGHIPGRCGKCPTVGCPASESRSCSWRRLIIIRGSNGVSDTQCLKFCRNAPRIGGALSRERCHHNAVRQQQLAHAVWRQER